MRTTQTSHLKEIEMNIEQALNAADESEAEGLRGLYPTAAQVLGAEVRELREHGADGLCEPETECGCGLDDFAPCGDGPYPHCKAAISRTLVEGEFIGDGGPGDKAYFVMPNAELRGRPLADGPA